MQCLLPPHDFEFEDIGFPLLFRSPDDFTSLFSYLAVGNIEIHVMPSAVGKVKPLRATKWEM